MTQTRPAVPTVTATRSVAATPSSTAAAAGSSDFGYFTGVVSSGSQPKVSFDRAVLLSGDAANKAAAGHGEETPVPNDYYVVNDNPKLRTLVLAASLEVTGSLALNTFAGEPNTVDARPRTVEDLLGFVRTPQGRQTGFHLLYGSGGLVVRVEEQYAP